MNLTSMLAAIEIFASVAAVQSVPPISPSEFEKFLKDLVPHASEPWETIPWRTDLLAARAEAIATSRPLFLWAMNGHPLGCT